VDGKRGDETRGLGRARGRGHALLPRSLHPAFGANALDRLEPVDRLDQHAVLAGRLLQAGADRPVERQLQEQADTEDERHGERRHQGDPATDEPDRADEQEQERQVDQSGD